jgi:Mn2+/Fe2+ NRAMP family transporter
MTDKRANSKKDSRNPIVRFFANLGPGLVTGAADDDPSGIATYSTAGALLGTGQLWTALITWPLMASVQMMCARIGMVTGAGLAGALRKKFPKPLIIIAASALLVANTINIGADLSGMADAAEMLSGINSHYFVILFGLAIAVATVQFRYHQIANVLKWLALTLFAYVITGFVVGPDWSKVAHDTFVPSVPKGHEGWAMLVAILGTTISPYLFFWQSSQEVEEEKAIGRRMLAWRQGATRREIGVRKMDVGDRHVFFEPGYVFYYFEHRADLACVWHDEYRDHQAGSRGAPAARRKIRLSSFYRRDHRCRLSRHPDSRRFGRVCFRGDIWLAAGT